MLLGKVLGGAYWVILGARVPYAKYPMCKAIGASDTAVGAFGSR